MRLRISKIKRFYQEEQVFCDRQDPRKKDGVIYFRINKPQ